MKCWTKLKSRTKARRRWNFFTDFVAIAHIQLMTFCTKLKSRIDESSPQAKIFYRLCRNRTHTINTILNAIEKQDWLKLAAGENFFTDFVAIARIQLIKFRMQLKSRIDESSPQAKIFYSLCHNRTHIINKTLSKLESMIDESSPQAKFFLQPLSQSHTYN